MALHTGTPQPRPNAHAWRLALVSATGLWLLIVTVFFGFLAAPLTALSFTAPLALGAGVVGLAASHLPVRVPPAAYAPVVLAIATAVNAPLLTLIY